MILINTVDKMPNGEFLQEKPEVQKKHKLFGHKEAPGPSIDNINALSSELSLVGRRVRVLEERYNTLRRKSQVTEQNMVTTNKKLMTDIKTLTTEMNEIKKEIEGIKGTLRQIIEELKKNAKKEEVKILEKYVNLWEPIKFVTRNEVEKIVTEIMGEKKE